MEEAPVLPELAFAVAELDPFAYPLEVSVELLEAAMVAKELDDWDVRVPRLAALELPVAVA